MRRILVVDDEKDIVETVSAFLEDAGFECSGAYCVPEAIVKLCEQKFDLVITDWNMPMESGLDLLRHIKSTAELKEMPVILMASADQGKDWHNFGFFSYVPKNINNYPVIVQKVKEIFAGKKI